MVLDSESYFDKPGILTHKWWKWSESMEKHPKTVNKPNKTQCLNNQSNICSFHLFRMGR